ncbi:MAG: ABC transporter transmembrane domain-containing protein, partial [Oscillospiraceae bacterium]
AFKKLNRVPLAFIDRANHGDVISRFVNDADKVADGLNQALTQFLPGAVTIIGTLIVMFVLNPLIATVVVLITPLSIFLAVFVAKMSRQSFLSKAKTEGEISGFINEMVTNQTLVKTFGNEEQMNYLKLVLKHSFIRQYQTPQHVL